MGEVSIDPVAVAIFVLSSMFGPQLAMYLGPYVVIAAAGLTGAMFALGRRDPDSRVKAFRFVITMVMASMLVTVSASKALGYVWAPLASTYMLGPIAIAIAYIGDDWPDVGRFIATRFKRLIESRTGGQP